MMRFDPTRRFQISFQSTDSSKCPCIIVYDLALECVDDLTLYAHHLSTTEMLDEKTILQSLYCLRLAKEYFIQRSKLVVSREGGRSNIFDPSVINDDSLKGFRDVRLEDGRNKTRQISEQTAMRTVNACMRFVYAWLWWLQDSGRSDAYLIGSFPCRVISETAFRSESGQSVRRYRTARHKYTMPLCYSRVGTNARHKPPGFVPTEDMRLDMMGYFSANRNNLYLCERNKLFLSIINHVGLRRESVNSLCVEQFQRTEIDLIAQRSDYFPVRPVRQKNNYDDWYDFPVWLAYQISDFILGARAQEAEKCGWEFGDEKGALFLSARSGRPLKDRSMTKLFSTAMRSLGAPKGASIHAWRHKNVGESIDDEIAYRVDRGLDTTTASIREAVSLEKGQRNPESLHAYVVSQMSKLRKRKMIG